MSSHGLTFDQDDDGWDIGSCSCGYDTPPVPGVETAAEIWCGHVLAAITTAAAERIEQLQATVFRLRTAVEWWYGDGSYSANGSSGHTSWCLVKLRDNHNVVTHGEDGEFIPDVCTDPHPECVCGWMP